jgi:hypothetical protein
MNTICTTTNSNDFFRVTVVELSDSIAETP